MATDLGTPKSAQPSRGGASMSSGRAICRRLKRAKTRAKEPPKAQRTELRGTDLSLSTHFEAHLHDAFIYA